MIAAPQEWPVPEILFLKVIFPACIFYFHLLLS